MRLAVTGTPGTGKTTAVEQLATDLAVVHLNDVIRDRDLATGEDPDRGSLIADLEAVREWFADHDDVVVESHLAHHLAVDRVVVLRCRPDVLADRLRERGESDAKAAENAEAEALDLLLSEAVAAHGREAVYEIETTERSPREVATEIQAVIAGDREPSAGTVDYLEYL